MSDSFSPDEILKIAINVEKNGQKLYADLESKATDLRIKRTWSYLKEQEVKHQQIFEEMLDDRDQYLVKEVVKGEYAGYLRAIASEYIVTQGLIEKKVKENFSSDLEAINFGIYIEKESILVYSSLKEYIVTARQEVLDKVINEEKQHLEKFVVLKESLKSGG